MRNYQLQDGSVSTLATTEGAFFLDVLSKQSPIFYEGPIELPGDWDVSFVDLPEQPVPLVWNNQNVVASEANDSFRLYVMFKATPGDTDPDNLWTPIAMYEWGWYGRAVLNDDDDGFELDAGKSGCRPFEPAPMIALFWTGFVVDTVIQPNGPPTSTANAARQP